MKKLISTLLFICISSPAYAIKPLTIKGDRALIDLEGESVEVGDKLVARNTENKARALLEVKQVKGGKAVVAVLKGRMENDFTLQKYTPKSGGSKSARSTLSKSKSGSAWGVTGGYAMNSMTVKPAGASFSLSGSSFNLSGFYQTHLDGNISVRLLGGYETLKVTGTSNTGSASHLDVSYLGMEALVRYSFVKSSNIEFWGGAGLGFLFAISKSSNVVDTGKITTNQTIVGSIGLDYRLSGTNFIPVQLDYALYPDNNTSSANQIILRAGYGFDF